MRALLLLLLLPVLLLSAPLANAMSASAYEQKISASLLAAVREDPELRADVMVQFEDPAQALERGCAAAGSSATRGERGACVADALQQFADAAQESLKQLLADAAPGSFESSSFFWINNSAAVKRASGALIVAIAQLDAVKDVRAEQIFQLQSDGGDQDKPPAGKKKLGRMALGVMDD